MKSWGIHLSTFQLVSRCTSKNHQDPNEKDIIIVVMWCESEAPHSWNVSAANSSGIISCKQPWPRRRTRCPSIWTSAVDVAAAVQMSLDYPPQGSSIDLPAALCAYQKSWRCRKVCLPETLPPLHLSRADELVVSKKALRGDALSIRMRRGEY